MEKQPKISVIVPVYNSEKYLRQCLDSLKSQTYGDLEILCIDDGSTDESNSILKEYSKEDERFVVIKQKHSGIAKSRNKGIKKATGEYISFVDSDDWTLPSLYEDFVSSLNSSDKEIDIYMFNASTYIDGSNDYVQTVFFDRSFWRNHDSDDSIHTFSDCTRPFTRNMSVNNKIYRTKFLKDNKISFNEKLRYSEDLFYLTSCLRAESISFSTKISYRYRNYQRDIDSIISENAFDIYEISDLMEKEIRNCDKFEDLKYAFFQYKYDSYINCYPMCPVDSREKFFETAKSYLEKAEADGLDPQIYNQLRNVAIYYLFTKNSWENFDRLLIAATTPASAVQEAEPVGASS